MNAPLTPANLQRAAKLIAEMERIEGELRAIFGGEGSTRQAAAPSEDQPGRKKRNMSAAGRARIAAAQRARWAKQKKDGNGAKAEKPAKAAKAGKRGKRVLSPEARAKIAAAQKRRWAKHKAK